MKVYFSASITGKKLYLKSYQKIVDLIRSCGHLALAEHILDHTESQIHLEIREERIAFHQQLEKWISEADCMVVEATFPSISVGYEISLALNRNKPVLILYSEGDPPALLNGMNDDKIICEQYTKNNLKETIEAFLDYVKGNVDSRFTFYLTSAQMAHLSNKAREKRLHKAAYLRDLISRDM